MKKIALLFLMLSACVNAEIVVTDYLDRKVELKSPARRIIGLAPHVIENLYSAGAGKYLIGAVAHSDYPEDAKRLPLMGSYTAFSYETILSSKPDLVVTWNSAGGGPEALKKLESLGLTVYVSDPRKLEDVPRSIRDFGKLIGNESGAEDQALHFENRLNHLRSHYTREDKVSVFYQVWNNPIHTINGDHIISDVISLCGGINAFADQKSLAPKLGIESILHRNPDVIVASGMGVERPEWLSDWKKWPTLKAVKNQHLFFIPPSIIQRHTLRLLDGAEKLCGQLELVK